MKLNRIAIATSFAFLASCAGGDSEQLQAGSQSGKRSAQAVVSTDDPFKLVITSLYIAYFGRPPDPAGLDYFASYYRSTGSKPELSNFIGASSNDSVVTTLVDFFSTSLESAELYSGDNNAFVTSIYKNLFNREPDALGKKFWTDALANGSITKTNVMLAIMAGARNSDILTIQNKIKFARALTDALDTPEKKNAYSGEYANRLARQALREVDDTWDDKTIAVRVPDALYKLYEMRVEAGPSISVETGMMVTFDGSRVTPSLGNSIRSIEWTLYSRPSSHIPTIENSNTLTPKVKFEIPGQYRFILAVFDTSGYSNTSILDVTVVKARPQPPSFTHLPAYKAAFTECYTNTPPLYSSKYCHMYAENIAQGVVPWAANERASAYANSNIGNIGMGGAISETGIDPLTISNYALRPSLPHPIECPDGTEYSRDIVNGACKTEEIAYQTTHTCNLSEKTIFGASYRQSVCYANNSSGADRTRAINSAIYYANKLGIQPPRFSDIKPSTPQSVPVFELGVMKHNPYSSTSRLSTHCLKLPSVDSFKLTFPPEYYYHSLYNTLDECEAAGLKYLATNGALPTVSVAQFKQKNGQGSGSPGELAASATCAAQPYLGGIDDPQFDSFARIAQFDACLHRAGYPQYDAEGRANCAILEDLLVGTKSTWRSRYCPYPF